MLYLEVRSDEVVEYFDHHPDDPTRWTFEEVLAGELDAKVAVLFGDDVVADLHARVAAATAHRR
jgi:hypothetical protein